MGAKYFRCSESDTEYNDVEDPGLSEGDPCPATEVCSGVLEEFDPYAKDETREDVHECGCYVSMGGGTVAIIVYCPLHAMAQNMVELLRAVAGLYLCDDNNPYDRSCGTAKMARALLKQLAP